MFLYELHRSGVTIEHMKNKQGKVYGLKFTYDGHSFKASEIGREFGYRILPKQFEIGNAQKSIIPLHLFFHEIYERQYPYHTNNRFRCGHCFRCRGKPSFGDCRGHCLTDTWRRLL